MRTTATALALATWFALSIRSAGATVPITACDSTVPINETGVLSADLSCANAGVGVALSNRATLDLAGHTLTLTGTTIVVHCLGNRCTVRGGSGGGTIRTEQIAVTGSNARISIRDVLVDITPSGSGANAIEDIGGGVLDLVDVRVTGAVGLTSIVGKRIKATDVDVSGTNSGILALATLRGNGITANGTNNSGVVATHNARITGLVAHGNAFSGFQGDHVVLIDSDVTGNGLLLGDGVDIDTAHRPRLVNTTCGKSHVASHPPGENWGVCAGD